MDAVSLTAERWYHTRELDVIWGMSVYRRRSEDVGWGQLVKKRFNKLQYLAPVFLVFALVAATTAVNAQSSAQILTDGLSALQAGDYQAAYKKFNAVEQGDPNRGPALLMRAMAENRLGRHGEALISTLEAKFLGVKTPQLDFETGWAAVQMELWDEAVAALQRFEAAKPGKAKTAELLGRAHMGLGHPDQAKGYLEEAMRRDPAIKASALYHLAYLERVRGNAAAVAAYLERLFTEAPDSELARSLKQAKVKIEEERRSGAGRRADKPWSVGLDIFGAYSNINYDNPNRLAFDGITLFAFARDDEYATAGLRLSRPVVEGVELFGSYRYSENTSNIVSYNYDQNVWSLGLQARF